MTVDIDSFAGIITHTKPFNAPLSRTSRVSWLQKKHSPTHTHDEEEEEEGFRQLL